MIAIRVTIPSGQRKCSTETLRFFARGCAKASSLVSLTLVICLFAFGVSSLHAAEVIPAAPRNHFNDYAGAVRGATAAKLESELTQFERDTTNQLLVVIYPHMQSDSSIEDYTVRVAQSWGVGQKDKKNGAVLFIFSEDHTLFVQVGYGLEGTLPDALAKRIIENEIVPQFRAGDFDAGVTNGVHALMAATKGEYKGTGRTVADGRGRANSPVTLIIFFVIIVLSIVFRRSSRTVYGSRGPRTLWWGGGGGGGGFGGGGGGGSFSGGGGSFGGGGAGGKW